MIHERMDDQGNYQCVVKCDQCDQKASRYTNSPANAIGLARRSEYLCFDRLTKFGEQLLQHVCQDCLQEQEEERREQAENEAAEYHLAFAE